MLIRNQLQFIFDLCGGKDETRIIRKFVFEIYHKNLNTSNKLNFVIIQQYEMQKNETKLDPAGRVPFLCV
jgi:hypothetical protein